MKKKIEEKKAKEEEQGKNLANMLLGDQIQERDGNPGND